jgi:hypothetical protein
LDGQGTDHVVDRKPFGVPSVVLDHQATELSVVEREKNFPHRFIVRQHAQRTWRVPRQLLDQRRALMDHPHFRRGPDLLRHGRQGHPQVKLPIPGEIRSLSRDRRHREGEPRDPD